MEDLLFGETYALFALVPSDFETITGTFGLEFAAQRT
jgi:hypothetical protein